MLASFFSWWLFEVPAKLWKITTSFSKKVFGYFSIDLLLKTLLFPWRRDEIDTSNMSLDKKFQVLLMNLVSRLVGATVRGVTIAVGLIATAMVFAAGVTAIAGFYLLPLISLYLIYQSFLGVV